MKGKYETPLYGDPELGTFDQLSCMELASAYGGCSLGGSVRELEQLASDLRLAGDAGNTERVDQTILSLLEKKIYRKIMAQSRRNRRLSSSAAA